MLGDETRLAQAVANLLLNAGKYTPRGGHIALSTTSGDEELVLQVSDDGEGIDPDRLDCIFDLFHQSENAGWATRHGLGVGLSLVKSLVEMHGGTVLAQSEGPGRGSRFTIRLPRLREPAETPPSAAPAPTTVPTAGTGRVLIVDDNEDVAASTAMLVESFGYEVKVANSGRRALELATGYQPQIVLLDLGMPRMDGGEVAARLRRLPGLETAVMVAMTGWGQSADQRRTREAGFAHHLVKPVEPARLRELLAGLEAPEPNSAGRSLGGG